jgi:hypothetical protein
MCGLVGHHETRADCAERIIPRTRKRAGVASKESWVALCAIIALVLGPATLAIFVTYDVNNENQPSDRQLTANFSSHEGRFDELVQMLASDRPNLVAKKSTGVDLATVAGLDKDAARVRTYRDLLREISVADLRYFPDSGKLVLVPDGQENVERPLKSYLYLPHAQPQSLVQHHGYNWREPGMSIITGDRPLKGRWFIHHEMTIEVAVIPY